MKRIKNADINFKLNPKRINLNNFSMKLYTVNSEAYFFIKDQDNVVSVEREATIYDDPEVIISGGTVAVDYYLPLDWSELVQLGEGVLNYRCINNIDDPFFPDLVYNQVVEDTTAYYIDSDIHIDPADDKNLIERVVELESNLAVETADREDADVFLSGAVDTEITRAISAETELSERIDAIESGASEALDAEIERAISAETALQDAIDAEEARAIGIENAIRQDLTDESEIRSSADTAMWTALQAETTRATSAETSIENKVDVETLRAIGVENAISGNLETYKATNNAALQTETTRATSAETKIATDLSNYIVSNNHALADEVSRATSAETALNNALTAETAARESEVARATAAENAISGIVDNYITTNNAAVQGEITRATSAETALQNAIGDEATARANADAALGTRIDNLSSASTAAIEAEEARAREAESGLTTALQNEVTRATSAETQLSNSLTTEINRATSAETAIDNKIDAETLRAIGVENTISGNLETYKATANAALQAETTRATSAETALQTAIDNEATARANADTALQTAITNEVSRAREAESGITNSLNAEVTRATGAESALDAKANTVSGNVITETTRATTAENALSGAIDTLDVRFFDNAKYENSGNTKVINFYNAGVVKATIDATDFIKDGMIDSVELVQSGTTSVLVITWNTDAGSQVTTIDVGDIFEADNYYTKSETSGATEISSALAEKLAISDFNTYSGNVATALGEKASQSTVDALSGTVTGHTSDSVIHVTSNDKEKWNKVDDKADTTALTAVNDALTAHTADSVAHITAAERIAWNAKADSSDVYLKTETSGATEIANALAAKQNQLVAGENITIDSANTISCTATGGGTVDETTIYVRYTGSYENYDFATYQIKFALFDYLGDKTAATAVTADITVYDITTYDGYYLSATFDYTTGTYTKNDPNNMLDIVYDSDIEDYKVSISSSYPNCVLSRILFWDAYIKIPTATIESGDTADVIEGSVADIISDLYEKDLNYLKNCYFMANSKDKLDIAYSTERASNITNSQLWLDDLKVENRAGYNHLSTNINIPLGTSGWTEIDTSSNSCQIGDGNSNLDFRTFRITCDSNNLGNCNISVNIGYNGNRIGDYIPWDYSENTFIRQPGWSPDIFSSATLNWDAQNYVLTVTYPESITVDGTTYETEFTILGSSSCSFGSSITKVEKYGELQQSIKPYVQQLRADVNTISGQVATKQDTLIAGSNITISGNVISATGGGGGSSYTAGDGIDITNDVISVTGKVNTLTYNTYTAATNAALASKQTTLTAGTGIDITSNVISVTGGTGGGISSAECQTMIESATTPIYQTIEDNEEVTAAALNVLNEALSDKQDVSGMTAYTQNSAFTAHTGDTTIHVTSSDKTSWNGAATNASNAVTALGGLSLVKLTQAQYDALATKDNNTLYVIVG